jgi:hypothetical protein
MKQATVAEGSAEPGRQRRDIRSAHGLGVPESPLSKTRTAGLTTAIPGINHGNA